MAASDNFGDFDGIAAYGYSSFRSIRPLALKNGQKRAKYIQQTGGGDSNGHFFQSSSGGTGNIDHSTIYTPPASVRCLSPRNYQKIVEYLKSNDGGVPDSHLLQLRSGGTGNLDHPTISTPTDSIRPSELGHDQEMEECHQAIGGGGGWVGDYIYFGRQRIQVGFGGTGTIDSPIISAVPASITTPAVTAHLEKLGYLQPIDGGGDHHSRSFRSAVERYQLNHDLEATGFIDGPTASMMLSRLCGVPDIVDGMNLTRLHGGGASCVTLHSDGVRKWDHFHLSYKFESNFFAAAKPNFRLALAEWARNSPFTFVEKPGAGAVDILVGFHSGKHGRDCASFNGPGGAVAHAFPPPIGKLHFDKIQPWSFLDHRSYFVDMETASLHEMGHVLGLSHSDDRNSVMYCGVVPCQIKRRLTAGDIEALRSLYS